MTTIPIDDQPMSATFFGEGKWLTEFITPKNLDIVSLHDEITQGITDFQQKIAAQWDWVAKNVKYVRFVKGRLWIDGKMSYQNDLWSDPALTARVRVGNCANKSFLLTSLLRCDLPSDQVYCVLGNLNDGHGQGGHAWVQVNIGDDPYVVESTTIKGPVMVPAVALDRYEAVHYFNDERVMVVQGKVVMQPFSACYSEWLTDYLDWAYIHGRK